MKSQIKIKDMRTLEMELTRLRSQTKLQEKEILQHCSYMKTHFTRLCWSSLKRSFIKSEKRENAWNDLAAKVWGGVSDWFLGKFRKD